MQTQLIDALIRKHFAKGRHVVLTDDTSLKDDLFGSDLDNISLVMDLEDRLDIDIDDDEGEALRTVGDVRRLVGSKLGVSA